MSQGQFLAIEQSGRLMTQNRWQIIAVAQKKIHLLQRHVGATSGSE
jgi:hypothetical protein